MSSLSPLTVMQPSAPYTSATVGLQTDDVSSRDGKKLHVLKTTPKLVYDESVQWEKT